VNVVLPLTTKLDTRWLISSGQLLFRLPPRPLGSSELCKTESLGFPIIVCIKSKRPFGLPRLTLSPNQDEH